MKNKAFFYAYLGLFLISIFSVSGFAKEQTVESVWTESPLSIDALNAEWSGASFHFEEKVMVDCAFMNDADNLYVLFIFKDPEYLSTVDATGMTMWFNTASKKKEEYGLRFRVKMVTADELITILENQRGPLPDDEKVRIKSSPQYFLYNGDVIDKKENILTPATLSSGVMEPVFRKGKQEEGEIFEFRMPLGILGEFSDKLMLEPGKTFAIGFEWGGLTEEMKEARIRRLAEAQERELHGRTTLGETGESREGSSGASGRLPSSTKSPKRYSFWINLKLAQK